MAQGTPSQTSRRPRGAWARRARGAERGPERGRRLARRGRGWPPQRDRRRDQGCARDRRRCGRGCGPCRRRARGVGPRAVARGQRAPVVDRWCRRAARGDGGGDRACVVLAERAAAAVRRELALLRNVFRRSLAYLQHPARAGRSGLFGVNDRPFTLGNTIYVRTSTSTSDRTCWCTRWCTCGIPTKEPGTRPMPWARRSATGRGRGAYDWQAQVAQAAARGPSSTRKPRDASSRTSGDPVATKRRSRVNATAPLRARRTLRLSGRIGSG